MSFSAKAQCGGFWLENMQPDTIYRVANGNSWAPDGKLPLSHTLGSAFYAQGHYWANVSETGVTELYKIHFCNVSDPTEKISLDWYLLRKNDATGEWETVNDNLSAYAELSIYTLYRNLNAQNACQSITWLGGQVPDGAGYCETPAAPDMFHGMNCQGPATNYPGAGFVSQGTPNSLISLNGNTIPAQGIVNIGSQGYDYFYADFLASTENYVQIKWNQVGDYKLVMKVHRRVNGTDWTNTTWNKYGYDNPLNQTAYIGGHQSCCDVVLYEDTLYYPVMDSTYREVCELTDETMGRPYTFTFDGTRTIMDTNIVFGEIDPCCGFLKVDTMLNVNYIVRKMPVVNVLHPDTQLCRCAGLTDALVEQLIAFDSTEISANPVTETEEVHYKFQYRLGCLEEELVPVWDTVAALTYSQFINQDTAPAAPTTFNYDVYLYQYNRTGSYGSYVYDTVIYFNPEVTFLNGADGQPLYKNNKYWKIVQKTENNELVWSCPLTNDSQEPVYADYVHPFRRIFIPQTGDTVYLYLVHQVNTYMDGNDTLLQCTGNDAYFMIRFNEVKAPVLPADYEICLDAEGNALPTYQAIAKHDSACATTTVWYNNPELTGTPVCTNDTFNIDLNLYKPTTNIDDTVHFYAVSYDEVANCTSHSVSEFKVIYKQYPVLTLTAPADTVCPGSEVEMYVNITNNPFQVEKPYTYHWDGADMLEIAKTTVNEDKQVGTSTTFSTYYLPSDLKTKYSYTQQIYLKDEVNAGLISSISFQARYAAMTRNVEIYLSETSKSVFANDSAWDLSADKVCVFAGNVTFENGWNTINFSTPFDYTANGNLLLTVVDKSNATANTTSNNFYRSTNANSALYIGDNSSISVNSGTKGTRLGYRNNVKFGIERFNNMMVQVDTTTVFDNLVATTTFNALPTYHYSEYNYTQQIYTADEVCNELEGGTIEEISFQYAGTDTYNKGDFAIYLTTTDKEAFDDIYDTVSIAGLDPVFVGSVNFKNGWNTIKLTHPYEFDGYHNLVVIVHDISGYYTYDHYFNVTSNGSTDRSLHRYSYDNPDPKDMNYGGVYSYRNNIRFTVTFPTPKSDKPSTMATRQLDMVCDSLYVSTIQAIDYNGCKSTVDTFQYRTMIKNAPTIEPNFLVDTIYTCHLTDSTNAIPYTTLQDFIDRGINITDECELEDEITVSVVSTELVPDSLCGEILTRTYKFTNFCGKSSTFTHTIRALDITAPYFDDASSSEPWRPIRLLPVADGNCTFRAPGRDTLLAAIAPYVQDNCTDADYLMSTIEFFWENTTIDPCAGDQTDIFKVKDHLTISAIIKDVCGNVSDSTVIFFLDRPDDLVIFGNPVTAKESALCVNEIDSLYFDITSILDDQVVGPFTPYQYRWISDRAVVFSNPTDVLTGVTFSDGYGLYSFAMEVTNSNGCVDTSAYFTVRAYKMPEVVINPVVENNQVEPYCPTYGNLTVKATLVDPEAGQKINSYVWSGESVNIYSTDSTTWITIVPENCHYWYTANVAIVDNHNCAATATRSFEANSHGIEFQDTIPSIMVDIEPDTCALRVPDFSNLIVPANINDACYTLSQIKAVAGWYKQYPDTNSYFNVEELNVRIVITNPCGDSVVTFAKALMPENYPTITINPDSYTKCYDAIVNDSIKFTTQGEFLGANPEYVWRFDNGSDTIGDANFLMVPNEFWTPDSNNFANANITYKVSVQAKNMANGCTASDTALVNVYYQGDSVITRQWPDNMCLYGHHNGIIAVDTVPTNFLVTLSGNGIAPITKVSDVTYHDEEGTEWNTVFFDSLASGYYWVTVTNNVTLCSMMKQVFVDHTNLGIPAPKYTVTPVTACKHNNGVITVAKELGYEMTLFNVDDQEFVAGTTVGDSIVFSGLADDQYHIIKTQISTQCSAYVDTIIPYNGLYETQFTVAETPVTNCVTPNGVITLTNTSADSMIFYIDLTGNNIFTMVDTVLAGQSVNVEHLGTTSENGKVYYDLYAYNIETECLSEIYHDSIVTNIVAPNFNVTVKNNNMCYEQGDPDAVFDGKITCTPANTYTYDVLYYGDTVNPTTLHKGNYTVWALNEATQCRSYKVIEVKDELYYPTVTSISSTPNSICDTTITHNYDGTITLTVDADVNHLLHANNVIDTNETYKTNYTLVMSQAVQYKSKTATSWNYIYSPSRDTIKIAQGTNVQKFALSYKTSWALKDTTIGNTMYSYRTIEVPVELVSGINAQCTYVVKSSTNSRNYNWFTLTRNDESVAAWYKNQGSTCSAIILTPTGAHGPNDFEGRIDHEVAFTHFITPYTIVLNGDSVIVNTNAQTNTIPYLPQGPYDYVVTNDYNCYTDGHIDVLPDPYDTMKLVSTPNHMCEPTFEKPGDGTIIINAPLATADGKHEYTYHFYDSDSTELTVPYDLPITHTKYWLAAGKYTVVAYDTKTGCTFKDSILVKDDRYNVYFTTETTPSMYCDTLTGTGTMTVTIVNGLNSNPDGVYNYSLDGNTWQANPTFTGLASRVNAYTVYVKDITTGCQDSSIFYINPSICQPVITIHDNSMPMRYSDFSYCINSDNVTLTGSANSECVDNFKYSWEAPCSEYYYSPDSTIAVDIDHVMANGCTYVFHVLDTVTHCSYSQPVLVTIYQRPNFQFLINNNPYQVNLDAGPIFCEQVPLTIATQAIPYNPTVSNATPTLVDTVWTLGHVGTEPFFQTSGLEFPNNDSPTFCVKVMDDHGCWSSVGSLPVNFNRIVRETQTVNACEFYTVNNKTYTYAEKGHTTFTVNDTISSYGDCGKIITYNITLYKTPAVDFHFNEFMADQCTYPNILSDMKDSIAAHLTPMDGSTTIKLYINRGTDNVPAWTLLAQYPTVDYSYNDSTFKFVATNGVCQDWDTTFHLNFPNAVVDSFDLATYYCNGKSTTITVKASNYGHNNATITLPLPNGVTLTGTVYPGVNQYVTLEPAFTPWNATFNNQEVTLSISNGNCPANTYKKTFTVDTTYALHVTNNKTYCERDTIKLSDLTFTSGNSNVVYNYNDFKSVYVYDTVNDYLIFRYVYGATNNILTHVAQEADTNMALRFNVINNCDRPVPADTLGLVINPLPKLSVYPWGNTSLCVADAVENLNGYVNYVKHADQFGWVLRDLTVDADGNYLNENFNYQGNYLPTEWNSYPATGTGIWSHFNNFSVLGNTSPYVSSLVASNNTSDKWLFTPAIDLTVDATLSFDARKFSGLVLVDTNYVDDSLYVYVFTSDTVPTVLPAAVDTFILQNLSWNTLSVDLSAYTGDTVYVAFRNAYANIPSGKRAQVNLTKVKVAPTNPMDIYSAPMTSEALLNALKDKTLPTSVYYYAENGCGDTLQSMGTLFFYDSIKVTPNEVTVTVCPEDTALSYLKTQINYTVDYNHYLASQIDTIYKFDNDGILNSIIVLPNASAPVGCTADTLVVNVDLLPSVELEPDTLDICHFATFAEVRETIMNTQGTVVTPTGATLTWSLDGVALTDNYVFKMEDNGKKIKAVVSTTECLHSFDTVVVRMVEIPVPQAKGDTIICANETATMSVVNPSSTSTYAWFVKGQTDTIGKGTSLTVAFSNAGTQVVNVLYPEYTATTQAGMFYEFTVVETNYNGCESTTMENVSVDMYDSTVITIKVTSDPQFIFTNTDNVRTHEFEAVTGTGLQYTWMIDDRCYDPDQLVYVEYDIYFKGENDDDYVLIQNEQIGQYLYTQTFADMNNFGNITSYVTSNTFSWYSGDCNTLLTNTSYYNFAVANPTSATAGNHFPNTNIGLTNTNVYDDLWMHFLAGRPVTKNFVPFRLHGDYKVVYRLYSTQHANDFGHLYCADDDHSDLSAPTVGGQNALVGNTMVQIAIDSINIHVTGEDNPLTINNDVAPELAPSISTEENVIAPEMEVWPNPAPSIVTTFKARVHNMSGDATVTITNFAGKQVYSGSMYIDSDNYYFEADVNSLAVGAYIMTVRTNDAVVTKKLVVTVRN